MKIEYLELKNFASVYAGMGRSKIVIDLRTFKNEMVMLIGPNGSGKTSLLATLHPFAFNRVDDDRDDASLILEGKDGYKEIHYRNGETLYIIKHHFTLSGERRSVKSFITKYEDGTETELNPNGNVTSFTDVVSIELGITTNHLSLLRLGSNVRGFIGKTYTERKNYASSLMAEIEEYLKCQKNAVAKARTAKTLLNSVVDKIARLNLGDNGISGITEAVEYREKELIEINAMLETLSSNKGSLEATISSLENSVNILGEYKKQKSQLENRIDSLNENKAINKYLNETEDSINEKLKIESGRYSEIEKDVDRLRMILGNKNDELGKVNERMEDKNIALNKVMSFETLNELEEKYNELVNENEVFKKEGLEGYQTYDAVEIKGVAMLLEEISTLIMQIRSYGKINVQEYSDKYNNTYGIGNIKSSINKLTEIRDVVQASLLKYNRTKVNNDGTAISLTPPGNCNIHLSCPIYQFYLDMVADDSDDVKAKKEESLKKTLQNLERYLTLQDIATAVDKIVNYTETHKSTFFKAQELGIHVSRKGVLELALSDDEPYAKEISKLVDILDNVDKVNKYTSNISKIRELGMEIRIFNKDKELADNITKELQVLGDEATSLLLEITNTKSALQSKKIELHNSNIERTQLEEASSIESIIAETSRDLADITTEVNRLSEDYKTLLETRSQLKDLLIEISTTRTKISHLQESISKDKFVMWNFEELTKERDGIIEDYDIKALIVDALSNKKGIPLLFQEVFVQDTKIIMNELLDAVYHGKLVIEDFIINEREYRIPYTLNGLYVKDVSMASQGESSFIGIALAFALIQQSLKGSGDNSKFYNIIEFDEVDATLDTSARRYFLDILQKQMEGFDQAFIISHNNMFDDYPVDVIYTGNDGGQNQINRNIIPIL